MIRDETEGGDDEPVDGHELDDEEAKIGDEIGVELVESSANPSAKNKV